MRRIMHGLLLLLVVGAVFGVAGCGGKTAATAAVATAQTAFDAVKEQSAKVLPEETQKLSDALATAKADVDAGKYKEAMEAAKALPEQVKALADAATKKTEELNASWTSMSTELPTAMNAVQSKVDALAKSHKLPAGLDAAKFAGIKDGLAAAKTSWDEAQAAFKAGNLAEAMSKVGAIKETLVNAMTALGLTVPAALQPQAS